MLSLPAQLTLREARQTLVGLSQAIGAATGPVVLDAAPLTQIDSAALAVLLDARRQAQARGLDFSVCGAPQRLRDLARLYGVHELLQIDGPAA